MIPNSRETNWLQSLHVGSLWCASWFRSKTHCSASERLCKPSRCTVHQRAMQHLVVGAGSEFRCRYLLRINNQAQPSVRWLRGVIIVHNNESRNDLFELRLMPSWSVKRTPSWQYTANPEKAIWKHSTPTRFFRRRLCGASFMDSNTRS